MSIAPLEQTIQHQTLQEGQEYEDFRVRRITPLNNLRSSAYELEHLKSGARILHVQNDDAENLFAIAFPTPPPDNTGLPHILEHSVLDGSQKYPAKKPFFEMVKMSMATFINAMTYQDKTVYPIASAVHQDFFNLAEVYCDAVFHPHLSENTLKQEGRRLDFAEKGNPSSDLIIKGIVYNEMKGVMSSADSFVYYRSSQFLFPDSPYGMNSGGDPEVIPDLAYSDFKQFHEEFYHPSNAYIFICGDIPTIQHLQFLREKLDAFDRRDVHVNLPPQPRWSQSRELTESYPVGSEDKTEGKTFHTINWLVGEGTDAVDVIAFSLLDLILLGNQAAPLRKAIVESKLGEDLFYSGYSQRGLECTFRVGLKGSEPDRKDAFLQLIIDTLTRVADEGIASDKVEAAFQQISYRYLEIPSMFPLWLMDYAYSTWIYGADPLLFLRADEILEDLKERYKTDPQLFGRMIRERLLQNPHRLVMSFHPDPAMAARKEAAFAERMACQKAGLSPADMDRIIREAEELDLIQTTPNSPEALASLPQLKVSDVPPKPKHIKSDLDRTYRGIPVLRNDVFAHGVNYLQLDINLEGLPEELYAYLPLYSDCVRKMGAAGLDYAGMAERVAAHTGGVHFGWSFSGHVVDPGRSVRHARFSLKALDSHIVEAMGVLHDYLFGLDPRDEDRLRDVLVQGRASHRSSLVGNGVSIAQRHAARTLNADSYLSELTGGLPQIRMIFDLADHYKEHREDVVARLEAIRNFMLNSARMTLSFTGTDTKYPEVRGILDRWADEMGHKPMDDRPLPFQPSTIERREGLAAPMEVAFCTQVIPAPHTSHPDTGLLAVASQILSLDYLMEEVRVKGGAYGGRCGHDGLDQTWRFYSYRDPWVNRTLDVFKNTIDYVQRTDWSQADIDRAIIGTAKSGERPIRPEEATGVALSRYLLGDTPELREERHAAILRATPTETKRAVVDLLQANMTKGGICVVSSREKLQNANTERPDEALAIEDILQ